ncbi:MULTISPECIES: MarR family transcriptional regulator [Streptomyces]|uniref:MarR family transcriptional regulator n=1 Tax=Streptomyces TaxID=1883 RepID=UPI001884D290|nr:MULTISPECIES: MarR family transcriptional regulator [Streptomyces]MBF8172634.1 MarR family transcriptional regulator [Streptomyces olivaceus]MBZ6134780.1 MarR family transcriptional regulator [Streptomyces olivaceus]MBZ6141708.1 MarR family transcriptional regulator [Streptomyces olivaceus]MBZ6169624.1 MarR family transcriptional regulator [Streptomyces olivaceus]MBZ6176861.1 MarR family transcriptional regulator [Streptomyces olivaceus]
MTVTSIRPRPEPEEAARVTSTAAELLEVLWGRASTAPASASQLRVLFIVEHQAGINLRTLADSLASTPPSTSRLCDRLQAAGLIEREVSRTDRREVRLHLSSRGHAFLDDLRARRERELQAVLHLMPQGKRTALLEGLEAFCDAAAAQIQHDDASDSQTA